MKKKLITWTILTVIGVIGWISSLGLIIWVSLDGSDNWFLPIYSIAGICAFTIWIITAVFFLIRLKKEEEEYAKVSEEDKKRKLEEEAQLKREKTQRDMWIVLTAIGLVGTCFIYFFAVCLLITIPMLVRSILRVRKEITILDKEESEDN
ncbi:MAG: hypothetical protein ACTSQF_05455 [Candidatus Heimdallarchaeaceae archaeon]